MFNVLEKIYIKAQNICLFMQISHIRNHNFFYTLRTHEWKNQITKITKPSDMNTFCELNLNEMFPMVLKVYLRTLVIN